MINYGTFISLLIGCCALTLLQETTPTFSSGFTSLALWEDDSTKGSPKSYEIDFEIGYGTSKLRNSLGANADELVCYLTSQAFPHSSTQVLLKPEKWYECSIKISPAKNDNYLIEWFLNDVKVKTLQTEFSDETEFKVVCSVENLSFLGNHLSNNDNYAIFDYFEFKETN